MFSFALVKYMANAGVHANNLPIKNFL